MAGEGPAPTTGWRGPGASRPTPTLGNLPQPVTGGGFSPISATINRKGSKDRVLAELDPAIHPGTIGPECNGTPWTGQTAGSSSAMTRQGRACLRSCPRVWVLARHDVIRNRVVNAPILYQGTERL